MRYEIKYRIDSSHLDTVQQSVMNHPASFRKIYPDRQVNNVYWDTSGLQFYKDNIIGIAERQKIRLRWYGEDVRKIINPKLEIKKRINELGTKDIFDIPIFQLDKVRELSREIEEIAKLEGQIFSVLLSSYKRSYWGTSDQKFRITIDSDMQFHSLLSQNNFRKYSYTDEGVILELKYDQGNEKISNRISQFIPFRRTKNSKYVTGINLSNT